MATTRKTPAANPPHRGPEAIEDGRIGVRLSNGNFDWFDTDNVMGI